MRNLLYNFEKYCSTGRYEAFGLVVSIALIAFMFSFRQWGTETFNLGLGLSNLIAALFISAIAVLVHVYAQKAVAISKGYHPHYRMTPYHLLAGVILTFISRGYLFFMPVGAISMQHLAKLRVGKFWYGFNFGDLSRVSLAGPLANIALALIARLLSGEPTGMLEAFIRLNILLAVFSMFPIPPLNGASILFQSRVLYVFSAAFIVAVGLLIQFANPFVTILGALVLAAAAWLFFIFGVENK